MNASRLASFALAAQLAFSVIAHAGTPPVIDDADWHWTDDEGHAETFASFIGEPFILTMFATASAIRTPKEIEKLKKIEAAYAHAGKHVQFVLVTLDPAHDSIERLHAFRRELHLTSANWHFLTGESEYVRELAGRLGLHPIFDDQEIRYSSKTFVADEKGKIVKTLAGLRFDEADAIVSQTASR